MHLPENAVVLRVDERPHIQTLEREQRWLRLADGKALTGFSDEYKRLLPIKAEAFRDNHSP